MHLERLAAEVSSWPGISRERDVPHALWLIRFSYLRYKLKTASEPESMLENESPQLHLTPKFKSLIIQVLPVTTKRHSTPVQHKLGTVN